MRPFRLNPSSAVLAYAAVMMIGLPMQAADQDQRIVAAAKGSYNFMTYLKDDDIKVACFEGFVTLTGNVSNENHKFLAQETVADLPGVKKVVNQIAVNDGQPGERSDAWVTMKVRGVLACHKNVSATDTEVSTQDGIVTLRGAAGSEAQKELTADYARDVDGVKEVRNRMVVTQRPPRTLGRKVDDSSITGQIKAALLFHKSTHALATKVSTRDGAVTLRGEAENAAERDLVTRLAEDIEGVSSVDNRMTLK